VSTRRPRSDADRVGHIRGAAAEIAAIVAAGRETFDASSIHLRATERLLGIIGEATRCLSEEFVAARPALQAHRARGMRNFLAHQYDDVDPQRVWDAATLSVPAFVEALDPPGVTSPAADSGGPDV